MLFSKCHLVFQIGHTESLLESATKGDFIKVVAFFEGKNENIKLANEKGETALIISSTNGFHKIVQYLLNTLKSGHTGGHQY